MANLEQLHIELNPKILKLIAEIDEFKGAWRAFKNLAPEKLAALRWVATVESVASSTRIEGVKLSDREVEKLISNLKIQKFKTRDEQEVAGYAKLMELIFNSYSYIPLNENHIQQLHSILLEFSTKDDRHRGKYKTLNNSVEAFAPDGKSLGIIFQTASPFDTPRKMTELIEWTNAAFIDGVYHPLIIIAIFTVQFLAIHPFQDGNGRLSRALTTLLLLKNNYAYVPYSSMENVIEQSKDSYYLSLRRTQQTLDTENPEWRPWLEFFFQSMKKQKDNLLVKVEREQIFMSSLPELGAAIIELAKEQGRINISDVALATKANRNNIKLHLKRLVNSKLLNKYGQGRGTWYTLS